MFEQYFLIFLIYLLHITLFTNDSGENLSLLLLFFQLFKAVLYVYHVLSIYHNCFKELHKYSLLLFITPREYF